MPWAEVFIVLLGAWGFWLYKAYGSVFRPEVESSRCLSKTDAVGEGKRALAILGWNPPISKPIVYPSGDQVGNLFLTARNVSRRLFPALPIWVWSVDWFERTGARVSVWIGLDGTVVRAEIQTNMDHGAAERTTPASISDRARTLWRELRWTDVEPEIEWTDSDSALAYAVVQVQGVIVRQSAEICGKTIRMVRRRIDVPDEFRIAQERSLRRSQVVAGTAMATGAVATLATSAWALARSTLGDWPWALSAALVTGALLGIPQFMDGAGIRRMATASGMAALYVGVAALGGLSFAHHLHTTMPILLALFLGFPIAGVWLGFTAMLYAVGKARGWIRLPASVEYPRSVARGLWLAPIHMGAFSSLVEEIPYRLVLTQATYAALGWMAALLIPAVLWALIHVNYLVFPRYVRVIEVGIIGIGLGAAFLTWGVVPVLVGHALVNGLSMAATLPKDVAIRGRLATLLAPVVLAALVSILRVG